MAGQAGWAQDAAPGNAGASRSEHADKTTSAALAGIVRLAARKIRALVIPSAGVLLGLKSRRMAGPTNSGPHDKDRRFFAAAKSSGAACCGRSGVTPRYHQWSARFGQGD